MEFYVDGELLGGFFFDFLMGLGVGEGGSQNRRERGNMKGYEMGGVLFCFIWGFSCLLLSNLVSGLGYVHDRS